MTPKEKAEDLVNKFFQFKPRFKLDIDNEKEYYQAKQCALIAVDEILDLIITIYDYDRESLDPYWKQVKQELEKL
jgi:hypothetical protein